MITLNDVQKNLIHLHILSEYPREACGVLTDDYYYPLPNVSDTPEKSFTPSPVDLALIAKEVKITAFVHSHCRNINVPEVLDTRTPSLTDIANQKKTKIPWLIFATEGVTVTPPLEIPRTPNNNYLGRPFIWFINDCYTLVQDYYLFELGIDLPDSKPSGDYREVRHFDGLFDDFVEEYGFKDIDPVQEALRNGDLLLVDNAGSHRNHLAILHNNRILHQDMVSTMVSYTNFYGRTHRYLRYFGEQK